MNYIEHPHHLVVAYDATRIETDTLLLSAFENILFLIELLNSIFSASL